MALVRAMAAVSRPMVAKTPDRREESAAVFMAADKDAATMARENTEQQSAETSVEARMRSGPETARTHKLAWTMTVEAGNLVVLMGGAVHMEMRRGAAATVGV